MTVEGDVAQFVRPFVLLSADVRECHGIEVAFQNGCLGEKRFEILVLHSVLAIHLLHEHDPKKAIAWVKSFPVRHDDERALSENYLRYVNSLKEVKIPKIDAATSAQIAAFAEEMLNSPDNIARRLLASGVLHDFIQHQNTTKRKVNAEIYYWAGVCDRPLQSSFVFSLVQDYFETCIQAEPKSVQAKKCFEGLEEEVLNSYSGSDGTSLPADEADKLNKWRHQAGLKPKKYK